MKKFLLLLLFVTSCGIAFAKPILTQTKYLIGCFQTGGVGTVGLGSTAGGVVYPLAFYPTRDGDSAEPSDYWIIKEQSPGEYSFQNDETKQYIRYDATATERTALVLVDQLQTDESTLFTLELKQSGNLCYYVVRCAPNTAKGWNKRNIVNGVYPVGTYSVAGGENESFIFYSAGGTSVVDDGKAPVTLPTATPNLGALKNYLNTLTFSDKVPVVDLAKKEFYVSIPENQMGTNIPMTVAYQLKDATNKLFVNNVQITSGTSITFPLVQAGKTYTIEIRNAASTLLVSGTIIFTTLPLVQLYADAAIEYIYSLGRIVVTEPDKTLPSEINLSELRYRGATAASQPKKAYAVKLKNPLDGASSLDRSFLGLRSDNNWILDAMYIDPARMRNRVSTDLWNDFSTPPYYKVSEPNLINGTRGAFVEVFLNDSYNGIYCMTEKVDRKQVKAKKFKTDSLGVITQHGGMYKASSWTVSTLLGNGNWGSRNGVLATPPSYGNTSETWSGFEVKYPDLGDGEPIDWKPLYNAVMVPSHLTSSADFTTKAGLFYDLPVFLDYYLFIELMLATDNHGKNTYLNVYDQVVSPKMTITPWDLDGTWGRRWDGSSDLTVANQNFVSFINANEWMENNLFIRLRQLNVDGYSTKLKNRYTALRGTFFTQSKIMERFQKYATQFKLSGAGAREIKRWGIGSFDTEMTFVSNWVLVRLAYLDNQYLGAPYVAGINDVPTSRLQVWPTTVRDQLTISNLNIGETVEIVSLQGVVMARIQADGTEIHFNMSSFKPGIYIVKAAGFSAKVMKI